MNLSNLNWAGDVVGVPCPTVIQLGGWRGMTESMVDLPACSSCCPDSRSCCTNPSIARHETRAGATRSTRSSRDAGVCRPGSPSCRSNPFEPRYGVIPIDARTEYDCTNNLGSPADVKSNVDLTLT